MAEIEASDQIVLSKEQMQLQDLKLGVVSKVALPQYITARGIIDVPPTHRASVNVFYGGYVRKLDLLPGQEVKKGELLFTIQNPEFIRMQEEYLEAKGKLIFLANDYERQKTLVSEAISSEKKFGQAESDYMVAKARIESLREQLELINVNIPSLEAGKVVSAVPVYSPISGFVSDLSINKGTYLSPQDVALQVINSEHMHLELKVYEKDVPKLRKGQKIVYGVDSDETVWEGEVHVIEKVIDQQNRTVQVHGHIPDGNTQLVVGMFVDAQIEVSSREVYAVPQDAIIDMDGVKFVLVSGNADSVLTKMEVKTGQMSEKMVEILSQDIAGKRVVLAGAYDIFH